MDFAALTNRLSAMTPAKKAFIALSVLFVLTLAAYSNSFNTQFHFDDYHQLVKNPNVRSLSNVPRFFTDAGLVSYYKEMKNYRPLTQASFALNYAVSGYGVLGYHVLNFLLHVLNAFLVYLAVGMVLRGAGRRNALFIALLTSLVFVLHPIQTNAVTYISGRSALLASFFYLLALVSFLRFRAGGSKWPVWVFLSPVFFLLGLLSKEMAVGLLGLTAAYDLVFTLPKKEGLAEKLKAFLCYIPFIVFLGGYLAARKVLSGFVTSGDASPPGMLEYLMSEAKALLMYVRLLVLPMNQNVDYDLQVTKSPDVLVVVSVLLVMLLVALLYRLRKKSPELTFFGAWFFIAIAPESSLVPIMDLAVEYRLYLPSVGFIAALLLLMDGLLKTGAFKRGLAAALVVMLGLLTVNRNTVWATEYTLWRDAVKKSPHSARTHANFGSALLDVKRYPEAISELNRSLEINPFYTQSYNVYNDLGICLCELGMYEDSLTQFERAIVVSPGYVNAYGNMGVAYYKLGRYAEAAETFQKAIIFDPGYVQGYYNLGLIHLKLGMLKEARKDMEEALSMSPDDYKLHYGLASICEAAGDKQGAVEQARAALGLAPDESERKDINGMLARLNSYGGRK